LESVSDWTKERPEREFMFGGAGEFADKYSKGQDVDAVDTIFAALDMAIPGLDDVAVKAAAPGVAALGATLGNMLMRGGDVSEMARAMPSQAGIIGYHGSPHKWEIVYSGTKGKPSKKIYKYGEKRPGYEENYFGGIFAGNKQVAGSHGDNLQKIAIDPDKVWGHDDLRHFVMYDPSGADEIKAIFDSKDLSDDEVYDLADFIAGDKQTGIDDFVSGLERLKEITGYSDLSEIDWSLQGVAGEIARRKGASAVWLPDEHGESLLVLDGSGTKILD